MQSSLKTKLVLIIVAILAVTIGIAPWSAIKVQERQLLRASAERLDAVHDMVTRHVIDTGMLTGEGESVQRSMEAVGGQPDVELARVFDTRGVIRFSSRPDERGQQLSQAEMSRYYGHVAPMLVYEGRRNPSYTLVHPVFNQPACLACHLADQHVLGIVQVTMSLDPVWRQLDELRRTAGLATLATLMVVAIAIWLSLTYFVDHPLQHLVSVMAQAARGDLSVRVGMQRTDELGRLAGHFDRMISELAAAQQTLSEYHQEQLARADRLATIGEMAAAMAHEIRNPLTGISGVLSVLSRDFPSADPRQEILRQAHLLIERLDKSVGDILHYARPSAARFQPVDVDQVVSSSLSLLEGEAKKSRVRLLCDRPRVKGSALSVANADPQQLQQVVMNLILNAIQATPAGGEVRISRFPTADTAGRDWLSIQIEDTGKGMSREEAAKAFYPFFSSKPHGTGLGLPIARQIVEQHGGRIEMRSALGVGTCLRIDLPTVPETPAAEA